MVFPTKVRIIGKRGHLQKLMCVTSLNNPKCFNCGLTYFFLVIFEVLRGLVIVTQDLRNSILVIYPVPPVPL